MKQLDFQPTTFNIAGQQVAELNPPKSQRLRLCAAQFQ
jgi:hypothetical protein